MALTHFTVQAPTPGYNGFASGAVVTADGVFREHFPRGGIAVATGETPPVGIVPAETPFKIINGVLCDASGSPGVRLKCDQTALGLSTTLQYEASFHNVDVSGKPSSIAGFTFNAQPTDTPLNLLTVTPVASVVAVALGGLLSTQITDATTLGRSLLTASTTAAIRALIGADRFQFLGNVTSQAAMLALTGERGDYCNRTDLGDTFVLTDPTAPTLLVSWTSFAYPVTTVAGKSGAVTLVKADVGLALADNVADLNKPVSGPQAAALLGLVQAAKNPDLLVTGAITVDGSDLMTSAAVAWPDGSPGTLTITSRDSTSAVLGYNITYGSPVAKTYTQPTITRNANGAATNVPAIVVT